jgi:hypothetical protein
MTVNLAVIALRIVAAALFLAVCVRAMRAAKNIA